jgi:hypothetical protein
MAKLDVRDPQNWIPRELFAAYVGPDSEALLAYYDKAKVQKNPLLMSFNLLAVLVLPAWLGLRQQWAMWATFTGLIGVVPFFEHALGVELPSSVFVGVGVAMGAMARGFLLTSANGRYLKLKRKGLTDGAIREALDGKARSNIPFAVAGGFGSLTVIVGLAHLAQILTGQLGPR